jgi:hypothetical protein
MPKVTGGRANGNVPENITDAATGNTAFFRSSFSLFKSFLIKYLILELEATNSVVS